MKKKPFTNKETAVRKFRCINGWTVRRMVTSINRGNKGRRSVSNEVGACSYRADDGNRCGVGCFITNKDYRRGMEGLLPKHTLPGSSLFDNFPQLIAKMPLTPEGLLALQRVHDIKTPPNRDPRPFLIAWIRENVIGGESI